jgi:glycosyltransferase involved in cell wall biosynthesis
VRVLIDGAVLAKPRAGTARWVSGVARALESAPSVDVSLVVGLRRMRRGGWLHRAPNVALERWWYDVALPRLAAREAPDALLMPANLTARPTRIPQVATILDVNFLTRPGTYERSLVVYLRWAYRRAVRDAARLTTISEFSRSEIAQHLDVDPARIEVVYPGLDPVKAAANGEEPHPRPYALYLGATERHKNPGLLAAAWHKRSPGGLDLVFVGQPGREHDALVRAAAASSGRIHVRGRAANDEVERWYRHASVFLFPSLVEGFGYPPLEAMQRGVPVVSSTAGSLPEVLRDGAAYFEPHDPDAMVRQVELLVGDTAARGELVRRGHAVAARYSWDSAAGTMAHILRDAATERR